MWEDVYSVLTSFDLVVRDLSSLWLLFMFLTFICFTPRVAEISAVSNELGGRMAFAVVCTRCGMAWIMAFAVCAVGTLFGLAQAVGRSWRGGALR